MTQPRTAICNYASKEIPVLLFRNGRRFELTPAVLVEDPRLVRAELERWVQDHTLPDIILSAPVESGDSDG